MRYCRRTHVELHGRPGQTHAKAAGETVTGAHGEAVGAAGDHRQRDGRRSDIAEVFKTVGDLGGIDLDRLSDFFVYEFICLME